MAVRRVYDYHVAADVNERLYPRFPVGTDADGRPAPEPPHAVLAGRGVFFYLLDVLHRDEPAHRRTARGAAAAGDSALTANLDLGLKLVDEVDDVEEAGLPLLRSLNVPGTNGVTSLGLYIKEGYSIISF